MKQSDTQPEDGEERWSPHGHEHAGDTGNGQLIYLGITDALREDRAIDHATARFIAEHSGGKPGSSLYELSTSGALARGLGAELEAWHTQTPVELEPWVNALEEYTEVRPDPRAIAGWHFLWPTALIRRRPSAQIGRPREMGWFGLFPREDQLGGLIFTVDGLGCRTFSGTTSNEELMAQWDRIRGEYQYFHQVCRGEGTETTPN
jgi:hypothetical protein